MLSPQVDNTIGIELALESGIGLWHWNVATGEIRLQPPNNCELQLPGRLMLNRSSHNKSSIDSTASDSFWALVHPGDTQRLRRYFVSAMRNQSRIQTVVRVRGVTKDNWQWVTIRGQAVGVEPGPAHGVNKRCVAFSGVFHNNHADCAPLESQESTCALAIEASDSGVWQWDIPGKTFSFSDQCFQLLGYPPRQPTRRPGGSLAWWFDKIRPIDRFHIVRAFMRARDRNTAIQIKIRIRSASGSLKWLQISGKPVRHDQDHHAIRFVGTISDITREQETAEELHTRRQQLLAAQSLGKLGYWHFEPMRGGFIVSEETFAIFGLEPTEENLISIEQWIDMMIPGDRERALHAFEDSLLHRNDYDTSWILADPERHVHVIAHHDYIASEGRFHCWGTIQDVTDIKQTEYTIRENNERLELALQCVGQGMWLIYPDQDIIVLTESWCRLFANGEKQMIISTDEFNQKIHPADTAEKKQLFMRHLAGETMNYEAIYRFRFHENTPYRWIQANGRLIETSDGSDSRMIIGFHRDITEQKQIEQLITKQQKEKEIILDNVSEGVLYFSSPDLTIAWGNNEAGLHAGMKRDELTGKKCYETLYDRDQPCEFCPAVRAFRDGQTHLWTGQMNDGRYRMLAATPVIENGLICGVVETVTDITSHKQWEHKLQGYADQLTASNQKLEQMCRKADEANRIKSDFLANMSHEIRTPMTAILGYAELLNEPQNEVLRDKAINIILRNGRHLLQLLNDILDLSKIEAGKLEIEPCRVSLVALLCEVEMLMQIKAKAQGLDFTIESQDQIPEWIHTDPVRLKQILFNLINNAIKFTREGQVRVVVSYGSHDPDQPLLHIEVHDTGIGIEESQLQNIFEPFRQADSSTTRQFGGSGLGLAVSRQLALNLGGNIQVTSQPGKGSVFSLSINPGPQAAQSRMLSRIDSYCSTADNDFAMGELATSGLFEGLDLILVEDGKDNQRLIEFLLKKVGITIEIAENGQEALQVMIERGNTAEHDAARKRMPDMILMDMQMPIMDGYTATRRLRELGFTCPIIALTANAMSTDRNKCLEAGCDDYLSKPIDRQALFTMIRKWCFAPKAIDVEL